MSILNDYLKRNLGFIALKEELKKLIGDYNKYTGRVMFVYAADHTKSRLQNGHDISMNQQDFYVIQDILRESPNTIIDFYIETPGGSGEAAEEIARFLRKKFPDGVNFVIAGEAKSAGTILALSGDRIFMTQTGSMGPIDAQVKIGRFVVSAHDYKEWIDEKQKEAATNGSLNPFDAIMIAQISPGEVKGVLSSLEFAKDLVKEWLPNYKFKNWTVTKTRGIVVDDAMRKDRAEEVAEKLCNHTAWRTHGRSLKIEDLIETLEIDDLDIDPQLAEIVYRIRTVIRLMFDQSSSYKIFFMEDFELAKNYVIQQSQHSAGIMGLPGVQQTSSPGGKGVLKPQPTIAGKPQQIDTVNLNVKCPQCNKKHNLTAYLDITTEIIVKGKLPTSPLIQENDILVCDDCNFAVDLKPLKNQFEAQTRRKLNF